MIERERPTKLGRIRITTNWRNGTIQVEDRDLKLLLGEIETRSPGLLLEQRAGRQPIDADDVGRVASGVATVLASLGFPPEVYHLT